MLPGGHCLSALMLLLLAGLGGRAQQSPVYVLNEHAQLVTSSTLHWVTSENGHRPADSVPGGQNGTARLHVCRAALKGGGSYHSGQLNSNGGGCKIIIGEQVLSYQRYQVLVNTDGAGRLEWVGWRQFRPLPAGVVAAEQNVYVARTWTDLDKVVAYGKIDAGRMDEPVEEAAPDRAVEYRRRSRGYKLRIRNRDGTSVSSSSSRPRRGVEVTPRALTVGGLYMAEQYGLILVPGGPPGQRRQTAGQILVEHEPLKFELTDFKRGRMRAEERAEVELKDKSVEILASGKESSRPSSSFSSSPPSFELGEVFNLTFPRQTYFGKGHSIPTGGPVRVDFRNQSKLDLRWGVEAETLEARQFRIAYQVQQGNKIKVTLSATKIRQKYEYGATLLSHFADGAILMRPIRGVYQVTYYDQFRPVFGKEVPIEQQEEKEEEEEKVVPPVASGEIRYLFTTAPSTIPASRSTPPSMLKSYRYPLKDSDRMEKVGLVKKASQGNDYRSGVQSLEGGRAFFLLAEMGFVLAILL